jgi:hypothetical protein
VLLPESLVLVAHLRHATILVITLLALLARDCHSSLQATSAEISVKVKEAEETEAEIDKTREKCVHPFAVCMRREAMVEVGRVRMFLSAGQRALYSGMQHHCVFTYCLCCYSLGVLQVPPRCVPRQLALLRHLRPCQCRPDVPVLPALVQRAGE